MKWTSEIPIESGYYWLRNFVIVWGKTPDSMVADAVPVRVGDGEFYFPGNEVGFGFGEMDKGEWYGPIHPPK